MALTIDELIRQIKSGKVIPIIGYDLFYSHDGIAASDKDFLHQLIELHAKHNQKALPDKNSEIKTGNDLINAYYHTYYDDPNTFKIGLSETIQKERLNFQLVPDRYRKLVSIKHFKMFVNATFTNALELAINTFRAKGSSEAEIKSSYTILNFHPVTPDDMPKAAPPSQRFDIDFEKPLVYNLFGTHDEVKGNYILTDADYIELIYDLIQLKQNKFARLLSYLKEGYLLFLGCNFPDWFFRFFIRICVGNRLDNESPIKRKAVIDSLNKLDSSRAIFIGHYKIETLDNMDCNELIDRIYQAFSNEPGKPGLMQETMNNRVFISYCRDDEAIAKNIADQLSKKYIEFFLDKVELQTGDELNNNIKSAIDTCCLFIPVVSNHLQNASDYIWREWNYAVSLDQKSIWPYFQEFVDGDMLNKATFQLQPGVKEKILNKNNTIGIRPDEKNNIPEVTLRDIKERQYLSRVSGNKVTAPST